MSAKCNKKSFCYAIQLRTLILKSSSGNYFHSSATLNKGFLEIKLKKNHCAISLRSSARIFALSG